MVTRTKKNVSFSDSPTKNQSYSNPPLENPKTILSGKGVGQTPNLVKNNQQRREYNNSLGEKHNLNTKEKGRKYKEYQKKKSLQPKKTDRNSVQQSQHENILSTKVYPTKEIISKCAASLAGQDFFKIKALKNNADK